MSERAQELTALVLVFVVTILVTTAVKDIFGRPAMWIVGLIILVLCIWAFVHEPPRR